MHNLGEPDGSIESVSNATGRTLEGEPLVLELTQASHVSVQDPTDSNLSAETNTNNDTVDGAQESDNNKTSLVVKGWALHKQDMDRLRAAVQRASAASDGTTEPVEALQTGHSDFKSINLSIEDKTWYRIPREACFPWNRMEVFLRTWYENDEEALKDLDQGNYTLKDGHDLVIPQLWEQVLSHGANIEFSRTEPNITPPADGSASPAESVKPEANEILGTEYENRLQYTVKYYRQTVYDSDPEFETSSEYDEPVEFEMETLHAKLPALEEIQQVTASRYASPHRKKGGRDGKKTRLRPNDRIGKTKLKINSLFLLNVIRSVVTYSAGSSEKGEEGLNDGVFHYPYQDLYLHLDAMKDYTTQTTGLRTRHSSTFNKNYDEHLNLLQEYLERQPGVMLKESRAKWAKPRPATSFASIWLLLKPGTDVYVREPDGSLNAYVVDKVEGGVGARNGRKTSASYVIAVWRFVLGVRTIRPWLRDIEISPFDNDREILSLPVFPVRFQDDYDGGATKARLIQRGRKYFAYSKRPNFLQYTGDGLKGGKSYKRARVVVEHASEPWLEDDFDRGDLFHYHPRGESNIGESIRLAGCECKECKTASIVEDVHTMPFSDYREIDPNEIDELTPHKYMLMCSHMFAFVLRDRIYDLLDVDLLEDPQITENAIDKLVMDAGNKDIIKAIAKIYTDNAPSGRFSADFISGKGEGQIILLHGPPGTGKTLTAESVAEYTKRPLLSITAADLGHEPEALERSLLRYFRRASDWDAIVLLDEADVYLEQRSTENLARNSIVSVFLRAMDYFQGILFLTTNRVGQFDEAFASRIHLSLGYDKLDNKARGQIWDNLFQKLKDDHRKHGGPEISFDITAKQYVKTKEVMMLEWNGREIRNAFQTAVALAVYDAKHKDGGGVPFLTENHIEQVVAMSSAFREYMEAAHQHMSASEWAAFRGNRVDSVTKKPGAGK